MTVNEIYKSNKVPEERAAAAVAAAGGGRRRTRRKQAHAKPVIDADNKENIKVLSNGGCNCDNVYSNDSSSSSYRCSFGNPGIVKNEEFDFLPVEGNGNDGSSSSTEKLVGDNKKKKNKQQQKQQQQQQQQQSTTKSQLVSQKTFGNGKDCENIQKGFSRALGSKEKSPIASSSWMFFRTSFLQDYNTASSTITEFDSFVVDFSDKKLMDAVAKASEMFPSPPSCGIFLLEESSFQIIEMARKCIRWANDKSSSHRTIHDLNASHNSGSNLSQELAVLRISIHCIRAISHSMLLSNGTTCTCSSDDDEREYKKKIVLIIKLLFHEISIAKDIHAFIFKQKMKNQHDWTRDVLFADASLLCFHGFHLLGLFLSRVLVVGGSSSSSSSSECQLNTCAGSNGMFHRAFPTIPVCGDISMALSESFLSEKELSSRQILKIATQSSMSLASVMNYIGRMFLSWGEYDKVDEDGMNDGECRQDEKKSFEDFKVLKDAFIGSCFGGKNWQEEEYDYDDDDDDDDKEIYKGDEDLNILPLDWRMEFIDCYRNFISRTVAPWMVLTLLQDITTNEENVQDAISTTSKVSQMLLNIASLLEKGCKNDERSGMMTGELQRQSLMLQRDSIMLLLMHWKSSHGQWISIDGDCQNIPLVQKIILDSFGKCCAAAVRAVSTYAASQGVNILVLSNFHRLVGGAIDQISHQRDLLDSQYLEYCAVRSFHIAQCDVKPLEWSGKYCCESKSCSLSFCTSFPFPHQTHRCLNGDSKLFIVAVFHLCLEAKNSLKLFEKREIDAVIEAFRSKVIKPNDSKLLMLSNRILSKLKLQSFSADEVLNAPKTKENCQLIYIMSQALSKCYGPLNLSMMGMAKADKAKYLAVALECNLKGAMLMDGIAIQTNFPLTTYDLSTDRCFAEADWLVESCRKISMDCDKNSYRSVISSIARSMSNIGKRRISNGRPIYSIFPLLASVELFRFLGDKELASRFLFISSTLQSLNFTREALVALCFSVSIQVENEPLHHPDWGSMLENTVLFCHDFVHGNIFYDSMITSDALPELISKSLARLGRLFLSMVGHGSEHQNDALEISSSSSFIKQFIKVSSLDSMALLRYFVRSVWSKEYSSYSSNHVKFHLIAANEFIKYFSNFAIQRISHDAKSIKMQDVLNFLLSFVDGVKRSVEVFKGVECSLRVSLTIVLAAVVRRFYISTDTDEAIQVYKCLTTVGINDVDSYLHQKWSDLTTAKLLIYKASISLLLSSIRNKVDVDVAKSGTSSSREIINLYMRALSMLSTNSSHREDCDLLTKYYNAMVATMLNIFHIWNNYGSSADITDFADLLKILKSSDIGQRLARFITTIFLCGTFYHHHTFGTSTSQSEGGYQNIHKNLQLILQRIKYEAGVGTHDVMCECQEKSDLFLELFASSSMILTFMRTCDVNILQQAVSSLSNTLPSLEEIRLAYTKTSGSNHYVSLAVIWCLSSCLFALFFGNVRVGNFTDAHKCLRLCCDITKVAHENFKARRHRLTTMDAQPMSFLASYLCSNSFPGLIHTRLGQTFQQMALFYLCAGDARKSRTYAIASAKYYHLLSQRSPSSDSYLIDKILWQIHENCLNIRSLEIRTIAAKVFSLTSSFSDFDDDAIAILEKMRREEHLSYQCPFLTDQSLALHEANTDWNREQLNFLIEFCNKSKRLKTSCSDVLRHAWHHYTVISTAAIPNIINGDVTVPLDHPHTMEFLKESLRICTTHSYYNTISKAALMFAKDLIDKENDASNPCVMEILRLISRNSYASNTERAEALYLLAMNLLQDGRQSGELKELWSGYSSHRAKAFHNIQKTEIFEYPLLEKARDYFLRAWELVGPSSTHLSRSILRCLALSIGPEMKCTGDRLRAGELVHSSIGSSSRQLVVRKLQNNSCDDIRDIFNGYDLPHSNPSRLSALGTMYEICQRVVPTTWQFLACATCPTGELLFSVFRNFESDHAPSNFSYQTFCFFPENLDYDSECIESLLKRFDDIMNQSKQQLKGGHIGEDKEVKRQWWEERYRLDEELSQLLHDFEDVYFHPILREELLRFSGHEDDDETILSGDLSARFEAACAIDTEIEACTSEHSSLESLRELTVVKLKEKLRNLGLPQSEYRSLRKSQLIDLLRKTLQLKNDAKRLPSQENRTEPPVPSDYCTFLILDENLHRLPLEGMTSLRKKVVCRLPSLPFAIASRHIRAMDRKDSPIYYSIDPSITKYVIDPESNLTNTRQRISSVLNSVVERNGWKWEGCVGQTPSKAFIQDVLQQAEGLYLYFGHGAGERFFSRADIEDCTNDSSMSWQCSALVLMGCSSGELATVNGPYGALSGNPIHFEPEGVALSYLCAGAPCVVANLWDVTDHDIDRFSISFLEDLFRGNRTTIAQSVTSSRDACKLKYLVGAAPVTFGIPVTIKETM